MLGLKVILVDKRGPRFLCLPSYNIYNATPMENELQCIEIWAKLVPFLGVFKMLFFCKMCVFEVWDLLGGESESSFSVSAVVMLVSGSGKGFVPDDSKPLSGHIYAGRHASSLALQCISPALQIRNSYWEEKIIPVHWIYTCTTQLHTRDLHMKIKIQWYYAAIKGLNRGKHSTLST